MEIEPTSGPASGGTAVTVTGADTAADASLAIGGVAASGVFVGSAGYLTAASPALPPGALYDVAVANPGGGGETLARGYLSDFLDVPAAHLFHDFVENIFRFGLTSGCGGGNFCPARTTTRGEMAVFMLRAKHGPSYVPPTASGTAFSDVPVSHLFARWIEQFAAKGFTTGCGGGNFCPDLAVTRAGAAVFLLRAEHGTAYQPPAQAGNVFGDVPPGAFLGAWIERLAQEGITSGCGGGNFCPNQGLSRGEMSVFLSRTFGLP
jgi:hypothetical protein